MEWEVGMSRCKLVMHTEWINSKVLLYSIDNIQYPMITVMEKNVKKKNIYL